MKKLSCAHIKTYLLALLYIAGVVWVVLLGFDWVATYFEYQEQPGYQFVAEDLKLKSAPKDVIYSEAFTTASGTDVVRYAYLAGEVGSQLNEDIQRRTPVSYTEVINQFKDENDKPMETLKTTFLSSPQFYQDGGKWRQIEYATTTPEVFSMSGAIPYIKRRELAERVMPGAPVYALTSTFYPDPNTETTSVDGDATVNTWSSLYDFPAEACTESFYNALGGGDFASDAAAVMSIYVYTNSEMSEGFWECNTIIERMLILFDTSSLPDSASVSAATLSLYINSKSNSGNDGNDTFNIVSSNPASNTALVGSDFSTLGSTLYATAVDITSISTGAYQNFTLNSTGRAAVNATGISKFGGREGHDLSATEQGDGTVNSVNVSTADVAGTSEDPKLEVTYTVAASFSMGQWFPF